MSLYQNCIVLFITYKYTLWILILQQILHTSSVTSNHFDYEVSTQSNLPFINYHGIPETKDEMEKKNAMDTYNLELTNYMDDDQWTPNLIDHGQYNNNDNTHSLEIPFYWVIDVDGRKYKKKNPQAHLRKSKDVTYKKSYHKSPVKLSTHNDPKFNNRLKKKNKRSTHDKLHYKHKLMKKLDDKTGDKLKFESSDILIKYPHILRSKQSKKPSYHKIHKKSSKNLTDTNIENNMSMKNSDKLYKKVSQIAGYSLEDSSKSDKVIKNLAKKHSNRKSGKISKSQPKLETHDNLDKPYNILKDNYQKYKSSSNIDKPSKKLKKAQTNQSDKYLDKHLKQKHNNKLKVATNNELDKDISDSKNIEDSDETDENINYLKHKIHQQKRNRQSGKTPKNNFKKVTDKYHNDVIDKPTKSSNKADKSLIENELKEESIVDESDEKLNDSITNEYSDVSNKRNNHKKNKSKNKIGQTSNNKLKEEQRSNKKLNNSVHDGHGNESIKHGKNLKNKKNKPKSDNRVDKNSKNKLKHESIIESDKHLDNSMHDKHSDGSNKNINYLKKKHQHQKSNSKKGHKLKYGSSGGSDKNNSKKLANKELITESNNSHKRTRNKESRKKLETKKKKKDRKCIHNSGNKLDENTNDVSNKESTDDYERLWLLTSKINTTIKL